MARVSYRQTTTWRQYTLVAINFTTQCESDRDLDARLGSVDRWVCQMSPTTIHYWARTMSNQTDNNSKSKYTPTATAMTTTTTNQKEATRNCLSIRMTTKQMGQARARRGTIGWKPIWSELGWIELIWYESIGYCWSNSSRLPSAMHPQPTDTVEVSYIKQPPIGYWGSWWWPQMIAQTIKSYDWIQNSALHTGHTNGCHCLRISHSVDWAIGRCVGNNFCTEQK